MRNLEKWRDIPFPISGHAEGHVIWVAGAIEGASRYAKTHQGIWYLVMPAENGPGRITDEALIADLEALTANIAVWARCTESANVFRVC
jgi:hypothetical protein